MALLLIILIVCLFIVLDNSELSGCLDGCGCCIIIIAVIIICLGAIF